jgi:hypothetical protein
METLYLVLLITLGIILIIGFTRLMISAPANAFELLFELFLIDWFWEAMCAIGSAIADLFSDGADW